ncbi:AEC family transporter [Streptomyces sp. NPDC058613]|uniref:AEC family transporter n=1 Tax=unclassified Streptomyces TaxID=2593676 RepID=UPI0036565E9A
MLLARRNAVPAPPRLSPTTPSSSPSPATSSATSTRSDLAALFDWRALGGYAAAAALAVTAVALAAVTHGIREPRAVALRVMAGVQANTAYFAVPVFITVFGTAAPLFPVLLFPVLLFQVRVLSPVVISLMELGRPGPAAGGPGRRLARAVGASLATPLVLACNAGILRNLLSVHVPGVVLDAAGLVGDSASPVALFALGLHLGGLGLGLRGTTREGLALIGFTCLAFPLPAWAVCGPLLGIGGPWLAYLVLIAAMPTPQNLFVFAQRYDVGVDLSASLVIKTSLASLPLLPLWLHVVT